MDHILRALERADSERGRREPVLEERAVPVVVSERPGHWPEEIAYSRTRRVSVSREVLRKQRVIAGYDASASAAAYKILCTQVLRHMRAERMKTLAVLSPSPGEGKTLTAINLGISVSRELGHSVLLVDADLRRPGVHRYFGLEVDAGLSEHLLDAVPLEEILVNPGIPAFVLLPGGKPLPNSAEMLGSVRMRELVEELKGRYASRIVIFDLPPALSVADAIAFVPNVDAAIMVVEEGRTAADEILRVADLLGPTPLLGTVLNNSRSSAQSDEALPGTDTRRWFRSRKA